MTRLPNNGGINIQNYAIVMYNSRFNKPGIINGFEYESVYYTGSSSQSFKFVVWRPRCSEGYVFCYKSMNCHEMDYNNDTCASDAVEHYNTVNCGGNKFRLVWLAASQSYETECEIQLPNERRGTY